MMPSKNKSSNLLMKFLPLKETINKAESPVQLDDRNHHDDGAAKASRSDEVSWQDIQFCSDMHDDLHSFPQTTIKKLQLIGEKPRSIDTRIEELANANDAYETYSYRYNLKIVGLPQVTTRISRNDNYTLFESF